MTKAELRRVYKEKRALLTAQERMKLEDLLLINFQKLYLPFISSIHTYLPITSHNEIDPGTIVRYLEFRNPGLRVSVPKINIETRQMEHIIIEGSTRFTTNKFGIEEPVGGENINPVDIDAVLIPLLAFDTAGHRVGFGKGFYDRFLSQCRTDVLKIGLSFFEAENFIEDIDAYDVPLNYCVTPKNTYDF